MLDHLAFLLALLLSVTVFYSTGWLVERFFLPQLKLSGSFQSIFLRTFLGLLLWVVGYSIVKSGGRTFNLALLPLMVFAYLEGRRLPVVTDASFSKVGFFPGILPVTIMFLAGVAFFVFKFNVHYIGGAFSWVNSYGADYVQHSLISQALQLQGVENKFAPESVMDQAFHGLIPYHYFDLWLNAFISNVFGFINYLSLELVTYPLFMLLSFAGLLGLWELFKPVNVMVAVLALFMVGFGSIHFDFYNGFQYLSKASYRLNHFGESAITMPKLLQYLPFAIGFTMLIIKELYKLAFILLAALCMIYFSALVLYGLIGLFVLVNLIKPIWVARKDALIISAYSILPVVVYVSAYLLFSQGFGDTRDSFDLALTNTEYLRIRINIFGLSSIQTSIMYAPLLLSLFLLIIGGGYKKILDKKAFLMALLAISAFLAGLLSWVLALENADGMQLVGNNMPVVNMLLLGLFLLLLHRALLQPKHKGLIVTGAMLFLGVSVFVTIGDVNDAITRKYKMNDLNGLDYKLAVSEKFVGEKLMIGGYLKGDEEYTSPQYSHAHKISQSFKLGLFLSLLPQYYGTVHMSVLDIPYTSEQENPMEFGREVKAIHATLFYQFVEEQKKSGSYISAGQAQADFIKYYGISYLIASESAKIAPEVQQLILEEIVDSKNGERFLVLKGY